MVLIDIRSLWKRAVPSLISPPCMRGLIKKEDTDMKGSFFLGNKRFEVREIAPRALAQDEVRLRVMACGVCGTDVHIYHGEAGSADVTPPVVLGHEYAGVVEEVGAGVRSLAPGDAVAVDPNIYCGACVACRDGKKQFCAHLQALGVTRDGGFAQTSIAPAAQCFKLTKNLSFREGAMAEPLACCLHGIDAAGIRPGDTVCVVGGGAIGLLMVQLARLSGASCVLLSEPAELRRRVGLAVGADLAIDPLNDDLTARVRAASGKSGADVVIECVGNTAATRSAFEAAGFGATVVLFSVPSPTATVPLPLFDVYKKELNIRGSFINPDTHQRAVALLNNGRVDVKPLLTHTFGIDALEQAILTQMGGDSIKVMVLPHGE